MIRKKRACLDAKYRKNGMELPYCYGNNERKRKILAKYDSCQKSGKQVALKKSVKAKKQKQKKSVLGSIKRIQEIWFFVCGTAANLIFF